MKIEQPRIDQKGSLKERVDYLERYIYRLCAELQAALNALENAQKGDKTNGV